MHDQKLEEEQAAAQGTPSSAAAPSEVPEARRALTAFRGEAPNAVYLYVTEKVNRAFTALATEAARWQEALAWVMMQSWEYGDVDGGDLQEEMLKRGLLRQRTCSPEERDFFESDTVLEVVPLGGAPAVSRWVPLRRSSESGKRLFVCTGCGRTSPTPDKECDFGCKESA